MITFAGVLQRESPRLAAAAMVAVVFGLTQLPTLPAPERSRLAAAFDFSQEPLPEPPGGTPRSVREVHPALRRIESWISAVGASIALNDLDGDGLPNDVCYVDPRFDRVIVAPAPGTAARYTPFLLPDPLPFDRRTMAPMGCLPADLNEDGRMDLLVYYWGRAPVLFLALPRGNGTALSARLYVPRELVSGAQPWYSNAAAMADLDGDGHADLILGNYFPDGSRVLDPSAVGVEWMQHSMSRASNGGRNRFFLWKAAAGGPSPSIRFSEAPAGLDERVLSGWTLALGAADLDGDLLPEVYFANDFGPDRLLHNRSRPGHLRFVPLEGRKRLTTASSKVLGRDSHKGMGIDFGDVNGDGIPDLYVSNIAADFSLHESHFLFVSTGDTGLMRRGIAPYVDRSEPLGLARSGWAWESRLADLNNDGMLEALQAVGFLAGSVNRWPELQELAMGNDQLLANPQSWPRIGPGDDLSGHQHNAFFTRAADGRYYDISRELGLDRPQVSRGIALADVDGDGRLDYAVANQWATSRFYHNRCPCPGTFLGLHLRHPLAEGGGRPTRIRNGHPRPNMPGYPALGAAAMVYLPDGRRLTGQVDGGNGHSGKRSPDLQFGLGSLSPRTPVRADLAWRDRRGAVHRETHRLLPGWHTVLLGEGA